MRVGVISDTHSLLRPEALAALQGSEHILHAGDIGNFDFLAELAKIAPVTAIRGNIDHFGPCAELPAIEAIELDGNFIYMLHSIDDLDLDPVAAKINVVIYGHSHKPCITSGDGVLFLNPGSAGPKRFSLPTSVALLHLGEEVPRAEIITLNV